MRRNSYKNVIALLPVLLLTLSQHGWSFDLLPSRFEFTKDLSISLSSSENYNGAIFTPDSSSDDYYLHITQRHAPSLGAWRSNIVMRNAAGRVTDQLNFDWWAFFAAGRDIDNDGTNELVVSVAGDTLCGVMIYDWPSLALISEFYLYERDFRWRGTPRWETILRIGPLVPQSDDSSQKLLLYPAAGHGRMPKGIIATDPLNGKEIWHYWIAGSVEYSTMVDSSGLGKPLIIVGTYGSANGSVWNGTTDDEAYLCALDRTGQEVWRLRFPGPFTGLMENYVFRDRVTHAPRLFVLYRCVGSEANAESLFCVNPANGNIVRRTPMPFGKGESYSRPWNLSPAGKQQFMIWNPSGGVGIFDEDLSLVRHEKRLLRTLAAADIDHDGKLEFVGETRDRRTVLMDDDFSLLASYPVLSVAQDVKIQRTSSQPYPYVWVHGKDEIARLALTKTPYYWMQVTLRVTATLLLGMLAAWIVVWGARARIAAIRARQERERTQAWAAMASRLAHDVRTPLAVLKLSGQNLELELETALGSVPEHLRHYFDTFRTETDRTENVARGLLKFTRQAPPALEEVDLGALIRKTVEQHPHSPEVEVRTEIETDLPRVVVDHQQMISLVENLMSNSLKAMKGKGQLTVRLGRAQELRKKQDARDVFVLEIADTGRGIPPQDLPRIFEPYFSHSEGGTGLGLAIVKKIVEDHHGTISIQSTVGVGTTVTVRIPIDQEDRDE